MLEKILRGTENFYDTDDGAAGSGDGQQNTENSDGNQNTGKFSQEDVNKAVQAAVNSVNKKLKGQIDILNQELDGLKKFKEEKDQEAAKSEQTELEKKQEWEKLREQMVNSHKQEKEKLSQEIVSLDNDIRELVIDSMLAKSAPELKVIPEAIPDFISITSKAMQFRKEEVDGKIKYSVFPSDNGNPMINGKTGEPLTVKEYLEDILERKPHFRLPKVGGGGSDSKGSGSQYQPLSNITTPIEAISKGLANRKK